MAQPTVQHTNTVTSAGANVTTLGITLDYTPTDGRYLLAYVANADPSPPTSVPTGWTALTSGHGGSGASGRGGRLFYRKAASEGANPTYTWSWSQTGRASISVLELDNVDATNPILIESAAIAASGATVASPAVNPTDGVEALLVLACMNKGDGATWSNQQQTSPSTVAMAERVDVGTTNHSQTVATLYVAATASGNYQAQADVSVSAVGSASILLLRASAAVSGTAAVSAETPTAAVSAAETFAGTVAVAAETPTGAATAAEMFAGTVAVASETPTAAASGISGDAFVGDVAVVAEVPTAAAAAALAFIGDVAAVTEAAITDIAGLETFDGAVAVTAEPPAVAATAGSLLNSQVAAFLRDAAGFRPAGREQAAGFRRGEPPAVRYGGAA